MTYAAADLRRIDTEEPYDTNSFTMGFDWVDPKSGAIAASGRGFTSSGSREDAAAISLRGLTGERPREPSRARLDAEAYAHAVKLRAGWKA